MSITIQDDMMQKINPKRKLIQLALKLVEEGLVVRTWGNMSLRIDEDTMLITPTGKSYERLSDDDIVKMRISTGEILESSGLKPSSEAPMHRAFYRIRSDVNVVFHTHQVYASALSLSPTAFELSHEEEKIFGVPLLPISKHAIPGTKALHRNVESALRDTRSRVVLMARHGVIAGGKDEDEVFFMLKNLEAWSIKKYEHITGHEVFTRSSIYDDLPQENDEITVADGEFALPSYDGELKHLKGSKLMPYLDDFAQICGTKVMKKRGRASAKLMNYDKALCFGKDEVESRQTRAVLEKNIRAFHIAAALHSSPINPFQAKIMRIFYLKQYSKKA